MRLIILTLAFILYFSPIISNEQSLPKLDNKNKDRVLKELTKKIPKANQRLKKERGFDFNKLKPFIHIIVIGTIIILFISRRNEKEY